MNMHKTDIIQRLAYVSVPQNAALVEHSHPAFAGTGLVVSSFTPGNTGGLKVMIARMRCQDLEDATVDYSNTPNAALLRRLHEACIKGTEAAIQAVTFEAVEEELASEHRKMIAELGAVAKELGLEYERPEDPFLK